jgi:hypothetical protein
MRNLSIEVEERETPLLIKMFLRWMPFQGGRGRHSGKQVVRQVDCEEVLG